MDNKIAPYSFTVKKECKDFVYQVTHYPSPVIMAGGYARSQRDAEKQARLAIAEIKTEVLNENNRG